MKDKFDSYIFEPNPIKIENKEVLREREFLVGLISFGLAFFFYLLEFDSLIMIFTLIGIIASIKYRLPKLKKEPSLGIGTENIQVLKDRIMVNEMEFLFKDLDKILFKLKSHEGQLINELYPEYLFSNGKDNEIEITKKGKKTIFKFCIFNYPHYAKLIKILKNTGVDIEDRIVA